MSKILIFSDVHLHNWTYGSKLLATGYNDRLIDQCYFFNHIIQYCSEHNIDWAICGGDVFHTHGKIATEVLNVAAGKFNELAQVTKKCTTLVGNHDMKSNNINALNFLRYTKRRDGTGWTVVNDFDTDWKFGFISYTDCEAEFKDNLKQVTKNPNIKYLFMHQGVKSVKVGSGFEIPNEFLSPDIIPEQIKFAFTGHYHRHQEVAENLIVIGSPMQYTWSDAGDKKGFIVLDTDTDTWEFIEYKESPKFIEMENGFDPIDAVNNNFIKITNNFNNIEQQKINLFQKGARSVEFSPKVHGMDKERRTRLEAPLSVQEALEIFEKNLENSYIESGEKIRSKKYVLH